MVYFQHGSNSTCRIGSVGTTGAIRPLEMSTGWGSNNIPTLFEGFQDLMHGLQKLHIVE